MTPCSTICHFYAASLVLAGCVCLGIAVACWRSPRVARWFGGER